MSVDVVFFELRGRRCALPVAAVREVLAMPNLTPVPLAPAAVRGVAPVHGQVVPVVDLGVWFSPAGDPRHEAASYRAADKVLLVEGTLAPDPAPVRAALAVERVMRLGTVDDQHARPPPPGPGFVSATVLDADGPALLFDPDRALEQVRDAVRQAVPS